MSASIAAAKSEEEVEIHARMGDPGLVEAVAQREGLGQLGDTQPVGATVQSSTGDREEAVPVGVRLDGRELERAGGGCAQNAQVVTDCGQVDGRG